MTKRRILVTGATGYIGGRLVPRLLDRGHEVVCLARSRRKLAARDWAGREGVVCFQGDVGEAAALTEALAGVEVAYYLVHSMILAGAEYAARDRELAEGFGRAAAAAGVRRIVYLGGLGEAGDDLSEHLRSRRDVEEALGAGGVPVTAFRAAMIIGSGSVSFEILRYLVERLPVMVTPRWIDTECQPIGVADVLRYLVACLEVPGTIGRRLDIGGRDVLTYRKLMDAMASVRGLRRRLVLRVPVLTPRLSSLWIHLVTPIGHRIARPLAEGLRNRVVCRNDDAVRLMPGARLSAREAIEVARGRLESDEVETSWSDAGVVPGDPDWAGGKLFVDAREIAIAASREEVFRAVCRVGGGHGWYAGDILWRIRGAMDRLVGGPGLRRGRRHHEHIRYGDALDFWRVTDVERDRRLELRAEMRLPGVATLSFDLEDDDALPGACRLRQTARFQPKGLFGLAYWYAVLPLHGFVFRGMLRGIRRAAED
ncbi:MAG: SDR family oxidoreductase [Planctomycetota bacterium]